MNKIRLKITTPLGTFFDDDIEIVTLKTPEGYIGLQHNRVPFISSIEISTMYVNIDKNNKKIAAIGGGLVFVEKQHIDIFTDDIEWKEEINKSEDLIGLRIEKKLQELIARKEYLLREVFEVSGKIELLESVLN